MVQIYLDNQIWFNRSQQYKRGVSAASVLVREIFRSAIVLGIEEQNILLDPKAQV